MRRGKWDHSRICLQWNSHKTHTNSPVIIWWSLLVMLVQKEQPARSKLFFLLPINQTGIYTTFKRSDETYSLYPKISITARPIIHLNMCMKDNSNLIKINVVSIKNLKATHILLILKVSPKIKAKILKWKEFSNSIIMCIFILPEVFSPHSRFCLWRNSLR